VIDPRVDSVRGVVTNYNPVDKGATDAARAEQAKQAALQRATRSDNVKWLMEDERGRDIVFWLLQASGLFDEPFNMNGLQMAHNTGRAWVGREIHNTVLVECPKLFVKMMEEHKSGGITADNRRVN